MKHATRSMLVLLGALLVPVEFCFAQGLSGDGIQSQGDAVLERKPEVMRMSIDLLGKGKSMPDAIAKLKARRTKVEEQLATLGATKESLKFGEIRVDLAQNDRRRQMERMIVQRMQQKRGKNAKGKNAAVVQAPVDLSMNLIAEWPLKPADATELLLTVTKLQDAIKSADLAGAKEAQEPTEEEEEMADEMEQFGGGYMNDNQQKPGEPAFLFVAKVSPAERQKALGEAFAEAKTEATKLAQAAELELGSLRSLSTHGGIDNEDQLEFQSMYRSGFSPIFRQQMNGRHQTNEALGASPGTVKLKVTVNAAFGLK